MRTRRYRRQLLWMLALGVGLAMMGCGDPGQPTLIPAISGQSTYQIGKPVEITFTLSNNSPGDIYVLKWELPFEGFKSMFYVIEKDGTKLTYKGRVATRTEPTKEEYFRITFGEVSLIKLDVSQVYDLTQPGKYTLELATNIVDYTWNGDEIPRSSKMFQGAPLSTDPLTFELVP